MLPARNGDPGGGLVARRELRRLLGPRLYDIDYHSFRLTQSALTMLALRRRRWDDDTTRERPNTRLDTVPHQTCLMSWDAAEATWRLVESTVAAKASCDFSNGGKETVDQRQPHGAQVANQASLRVMQCVFFVAVLSVYLRIYGAFGDRENDAK